MKILLPIDGSDPALAAVRHVAALIAQGLGAQLVLANVQEPASLYELMVVHDAEAIERMRRAAGAELLAPAELLLDAAGLSYESEAAGGDPHHTLVELAENYGCDAIVMGARGMGDPTAGDLGSVALAVLRHSLVPVTVVRPPDATEAAEPAEPAEAD